MCTRWEILTSHTLHKAGSHLNAFLDGVTKLLRRYEIVAVLQVAVQCFACSTMAVTDLFCFCPWLDDDDDDDDEPPVAPSACT